MNHVMRLLRYNSDDPMMKTLLLFGAEGILLQFVMSLNGFGNNLYATNMGATDSQIGLIQMVPNLVACVALLPLGIVSDRMKSARTMPLIALLVVSLGYVLFGTVPALGDGRMGFYYVFLGMMGGGIAVYNAQWQAFFGDVTPMHERNHVFTFRNRLMVFVNMGVPILCGVLMGMQDTPDGKLVVLRVFYYICAVLTLLTALAILAIPGGKERQQPAAVPSKRFSLGEIGGVVRDLMHNRRFMLFFLPMLFFYLSWHMDWSMWYISQINYIGMNETQLAVYSSVFNIGQLVALGFVSQLVRRKSADFAFILGVLGLLACPVCIVLISLVPMNIRFLVFTVVITVINAPQCAVNLCNVQMLLAAAPVQNRSLVVSLYTLVITLSNSLMPYVGVRIYELLGGNWSAFFQFNAIATVWRIMVLAVFLWRYAVVKREGMLTTAEA